MDSGPYCFDPLFPFIGRRYTVTGGLTQSGGTEDRCEPLILAGSNQAPGVNTAIRAALTFGVLWLGWQMFHS
jgi:hypothetical protein